MTVAWMPLLPARDRCRPPWGQFGARASYALRRDCRVPSFSYHAVASGDAWGEHLVTPVFEADQFWEPSA
jgi:hypothetical protein